MADFINTIGIVAVFGLGLAGLIYALSFNHNRWPVLPGMFFFMIALGLSTLADVGRGVSVLHYTDIARPLAYFAAMGIITVAYTWPRLTHNVLKLWRAAMA